MLGSLRPANYGSNTTDVPPSKEVSVNDTLHDGGEKGDLHGRRTTTDNVARRTAEVDMACRDRQQTQTHCMTNNRKQTLKNENAVLVVDINAHVSSITP